MSFEYTTARTRTIKGIIEQILMQTKKHGSIICVNGAYLFPFFFPFRLNNFLIARDRTRPMKFWWFNTE